MSKPPDAAGAVDGSRKGERRRGVLPVSKEFYDCHPKPDGELLKESLRTSSGWPFFYRKLRPIKQNPLGMRTMRIRKMAAVAAALRRESPASRTLCCIAEEVCC